MVEWNTGETVPFKLSPGIIIASYFVSLAGALTTVELLHRRREGKGWITWLQQLGVAVSFGLVAIWCMHFVGNRAIVLGDGSPSIQLYYNPGFTTLSAFLPIVFLFVGFTTVELKPPGSRMFWPALILTGFIAGLAITGMHYIGNLGINNYNVNNPPSYIVGAAAIAVCASLCALSLFYYFKERWINSFPRRFLCACILAGAVSGMHWLATVGTSYKLIAPRIGNTGDRNNNLIVAIVLSLIACSACLFIALVTQRRRKQLADRAQHVVLACATFDADGKLLVTSEGILPSQKITKQYNQRSFNDEFNVAHPVFQWLYRVTHNWQGVTDIVPAMRAHLRSLGTQSPGTGSPAGKLNWEESEEEDYSVLFREYFCVAAAELADHMQTPLADLGVLYHGIMMTGSMNIELKAKKGLVSRARHHSDVETGIINPTMYGRGQLLFVVRQLDRNEASRLTSLGYRFATLNQVGNMLASSMQVPHGEVVNTMSSLKASCPTTAPMTDAGTYLACFALRPAVRSSDGGWEVLVPKKSPCHLPWTELSDDQLHPWQTRFLARLEGFNVNQCIRYLSDSLMDVTLEERTFAKYLVSSISSLQSRIVEPFFKSAVFSSKPVRVPGPLLASDLKGYGTMFAFCIIPDIHSSGIRMTDQLVYTPYSFFKCSQRVWRHSPDHAILARKNHTEFSSLLAHKDFAAALTRSHNTPRGSVDYRRGSNRASGRKMWKPFTKTDPHSNSNRSSLVETKGDYSSQKGLMSPTLINKEMEGGLGSNEPTPPPAPQHIFGGIMVSSDVTVEDVRTKEVEMTNMGLRTEATLAANEGPVYVDELFKITTQRWQTR
ncbi:hypothetical protein K402DRAFT_40426 [Aulographum hederae CBS 113979]|uniref:MHYT domain-containing protein n=1 Tax=Aulographum hederae CBS 113979 TaxID=1176131 RepID=A0A6G1H4C1_9PEZI|nr:hypothetical protein K402DRAFT_40426 [Aulographum hederae CBS 113979]